MKIDPAAATASTGADYPSPYDAPCAARGRQRLGDVAGLTQFGVNRLTLPPGAWSSQRHWHTAEDEFMIVLSGEVVLVEDGGETVLRPGDCAGWKAGVADGHHLQNRSAADAVVLEVGGRHPATDTVDYPDLDLVAHPNEVGYRHRDGRRYPAP